MATAMMAAVGCSATCPAFDPTAADDAVIADLPEAEQSLFCREQATFVYNYAARLDFERAYCLDLALQGGEWWGGDLGVVTDSSSCEGFVERCLASSPRWPWVYSCEIREPGTVDPGERWETVGQRRGCVTQTVCITWPTLASELDCALFGDEAALAEIWRRAQPERACWVPISI